MLLHLISPSFCSPLGSSSFLTVYSLGFPPPSLGVHSQSPPCLLPTSTPMNPPTHTSPSPPAGLAPIEGLPIAAQAVLHRELCHIHSSLQLILTILRGPWDTLALPSRTPSPVLFFLLTFGDWTPASTIRPNEPPAPLSPTRNNFSLLLACYTLLVSTEITLD